MISKILAGAGNDIIDLTSQRYDTSGSDSIYGGLGDDVIWSNGGNNILYGDAGNDFIVGGSGNDVIVGGSGNDTLHGGGGEDLFTFGEDWGNDVVEQYANGTVKLWFSDDDDEGTWDASSLTYTRGGNSVQIKGVSASNVTIICGAETSRRDYDAMTVRYPGCFDNFASTMIFEKNTGTPYS